MNDVNSFFRTKLAQAPRKSEDPIIDPGEAAVGGLALLSNPISTRVLPTVLKSVLSKTYAKSQKWKGDPIYDLERIGSGIPKSILEERAKEAKRLFGVDISPKFLDIMEGIGEKASTPQNILGGLFKVKPKEISPGQFTPHPEDINKLTEIQKSVNSMLDKYKLPEKGVRLSFRSGPLSKLFGPHFHIPSKEIVLPKFNKHLALHEIGHAAHLTGKGAQAANVLRKTLYKGSLLAVPMAYVAGDEIQKMFPGKIDDKVVDFVQKHSPAIVASTYAAASIYPEIQATTRAIAHVHKTEGAVAAKDLAKKLFPHFMSYTIPLIPAMVGLGLARKWHREAKTSQEELKKYAGLISQMADLANDIRIESGHIMKQIGPQAGALLEQPVNEFMKTMYKSGKNVVKSPEFAAGAAMTGIPTALISYIKFNTPHGKTLTEKKREIGVGKKWEMYGKGTPKAEIQYFTEKSKQDTTTPAIVGITSAISAGFLAKLFADLGRVM